MKFNVSNVKFSKLGLHNNQMTVPVYIFHIHVTGQNVHQWLQLNMFGADLGPIWLSKQKLMLSKFYCSAEFFLTTHQTDTVAGDLYLLDKNVSEIKTIC